MTRPYPDAEALLVPWLAAECGCRALTDLPADLERQVPLLQVTRLGGGDVAPGLDSVVVDVDSYGQHRSAAVAYAEAARHALRFKLPGSVFPDGAGEVVVTRCDTVEAPAYRPYENPALRRFGGTYRLMLHQVALA